MVDNVQNLQVSQGEQIIDSWIAASNVSVAQLGNQHGGYAVNVSSVPRSRTPHCALTR